MCYNKRFSKNYLQTLTLSGSLTQYFVKSLPEMWSVKEQYTSLFCKEMNTFVSSIIRHRFFPSKTIPKT